MAYFYVFAEPTCECDNRGTQLNYDNGHWCYLKEGPCELLNGDVVNWSWSRCKYQPEGSTEETRVDCPPLLPEGNNSSTANLYTCIIYTSVRIKISKSIPLSALSTGNECAEGECFCVSTGRNTCLNDWGYDASSGKWDYYMGYTACDLDQCKASEDCYTRGYWCDNSLLKDNDGN